MLQIGDRVQVDFEEVPKTDRDCDYGRVIGIRLIHADTPLEVAMVLIRFNRNYVKAGRMLTPMGIREIEMPADDIRITKL